MKCIKMY